MSIYKVDITKFKHDVWENDWYECPNCQYDSIDIGFNYCPSCGELLIFEDNSSQNDCFNCRGSGVTEDDELWCSVHQKIVHEGEVCEGYN